MAQLVLPRCCSPSRALQDVQGHGRDEQGFWSLNMPSQAFLYFKLLLLALELLHEVLIWCSAPSALPGPRGALSTGGVELPRGWQRAAHPKWAEETGMEIHTKLQGSKMDWREH